MQFTESIGRPMAGLVKQPNSSYCFACGLNNPRGLALSFYQTEEGEAICEIVPDEGYQGYPGLVHGGVLMTVLDEILGRAAMVKDHSNFMVTARMSVRLRKPVPVGEKLLVRGRLDRERGTFSMASAEVYLPDGSVAMEAEATLAKHPEGEQEQSRLDALGWKVYPD